MIQYVVGFAFSRDKKDIILIAKQKPEWQKGKFNGVGGKIEQTDISPTHAMKREFEEETGVDIPDQYWRNFATLKINDGSVELYCFVTYNDAIYLCETTEVEEIFRLAVDTALGEFRMPLIPNLKVLIPMALDEDFQFADIKAVVR